MHNFCTIIVPTIRPNKFFELCHSIEVSTISESDKIEVIALVDRVEILEAINQFIANNEIKIKIRTHFFSNNFGQYGIWKGINEVLNSVVSTWIQITSDDITYCLKNWNLYIRSLDIPKHNLCLLKSSVNKRMNINKPSDAIIKPDCFPYISSDLINLLKTSGDCYGSDTFFEGISYYANNISGSLNPFAYYFFDIVRILELEIFKQPDFGTDLDVDHQNASRLIMLFEWNRLLKISYQKYLLNFSQKICHEILTQDNYISINNRKYINSQKNSFINLRKSINLNEILNCYTARFFILTYIFVVIFTSFTDNRISKKFHIKSQLNIIYNNIIKIAYNFPPPFTRKFFHTNIKKSRIKRVPDPVAIYFNSNFFGKILREWFSSKMPYFNKFK